MTTEEHNYICYSYEAYIEELEKDKEELSERISKLEAENARLRKKILEVVINLVND